MLLRHANHGILAAGLTSMLLVLVAACGSSSSPPDDTALPGSTEGEEGVRDTVESFYAAVGANDQEAACDLLAGEARRELMGMMILMGGARSCTEAIGLVYELYDDLEREGLQSTNVRAVTINGDVAEVQDQDIEVEGGALPADEDPDPMLLSQINGRWLITALG